MPPLTRRQLLRASAAASPLLASCAADLTRYQGRPVADVASELGVCAAAFATLRAGKAQPTEVAGRCSVAPDAVFQAASLTKPAVAYGALRLVLAGQRQRLAGLRQAGEPAALSDAARPRSSQARRGTGLIRWSAASSLRIGSGFAAPGAPS